MLGQPFVVLVWSNLWMPVERDLSRIETRKLNKLVSEASKFQ